MSYPSHYINAKQSPAERRDKHAFVRAYSQFPPAMARRARDWTWSHIYRLLGLKAV